MGSCYCLITVATTGLTIILLVAAINTVSASTLQKNLNLATDFSNGFVIPRGEVELSLPGCPSHCGNIVIPYPFGIGDGCYYNKTRNDLYYYRIICNHTYNPPKPFYGHGHTAVHDIKLLEGKIRSSNYVSEACYAKNGSQTWYNIPSWRMGRFTISASDNVFAAIGCDTVGQFSGTRHNRSYTMGCLTLCEALEDVDDRTCSGVGCCQSDIPDGITSIDSIEAGSYSNHINVSWFNPCSLAFVVAKDALINSFSLDNLTAGPPEYYNMVPVVLDWMIGSDSCSTAQANNNCLCKDNTICQDLPTIPGYRCNCSMGYTGNPYLPQGCQDFNECSDPKYNDCEKPEYCTNTIGNYTCQCPKGFHGSGRKGDHCMRHKDNMVFIVVLGICGGIIASMVTAFWLYWQHHKNQTMKARENFFRQNGGHLLHRKLSDGQDVSAQMVKIFKIEELEKASNKYTNVIGRGGYGVVYKGVLSNNQEVAIKRSLKVDPKQSDQFINEVILLSKLNHRNVVKLIGCCLHTEVPLLVYEFIDNETLYHHLHDDRKALLLTWNIRLRIALEVANVLSYLHTAISTPIIHRDMKSSNILLDANYTSKVSDFGDSRLVPANKDYLATALLGTRGYLDPAYVQTHELTSKSDVYSFGVVLVELLTRQKPLCYHRPQKDISLASFFIRKWNEGDLIDIFDEQIIRNDGTFEQVIDVANLAQRCLKLKGEERPTMEEVAIELYRIRKMSGSLAQSESKGIVTANLLGGTYIEMSYKDQGKITDTGSSNNSQVIGLLADPLDSGR